ncbi:MAG: peptide/nickel transport system permease protein [Acidobacteriota bacterium]|jgi:peptide/nickel transport system permease protein|nr:peptide/nickel transport system permease protein [Acidobacteriota bacterium]
MTQPPTTQADAKTTDASDEARARGLFTRLHLTRNSARGRTRLVVGLSVVVAFYGVAALAEFIAPYSHSTQSREETYAPATAIHFYDAAGNFHARPFIYARRLTDRLTNAYAEDASRRYPLTLLARGHTYRLLGLITTDRHLFSVADDEEANFDQQSSHQLPSAASSSSRTTPRTPNAPRVNLLGTDNLGRDRFSQLVVAARFSLAVAPLGALVAGALGILVGCVAGYSGRKTDAVLMRAADAMMALPALVLILAARAALPDALPLARAAAFLVAVFVAVGWAEMARLVRGLVLELRAREFVTAARSLGMTESRVLFRHVLPNASRAIVVQLSLMLPAFLLAETALSYLGVGVQEPDVSLGKMLRDASNAALLREQPFTLLSPAIVIFLFVLGIRLLSDGLRRDHSD